DELRHHGLDHLDAIHAPMVDLKIERLHGTGDVESEHDVDAVGGHFGAAVAALWAREPDNHECAREQGQQPQPAPDARAAATGHLSGETHIREFDGGHRTAPA